MGGKINVYCISVKNQKKKAGKPNVSGRLI
jgi:hypothetical protein